MSHSEHSRKDIEYHAAIADQYDKVVVEPRWSSINALFKPIAKHMPARRETMLDIGTGTGHMLLRYAHLFRSVVAIDHSAAMLAVAQSSAARAGLTHIAFAETDAVEYLDASDTSFDLITCVGFLHHLQPMALPTVLGQLRRRLAPGGRLLISEPILSEMREPLFVRWWNKDYADNPDVYAGNPVDPEEAPLDRQTLQTAISRAGLKPVTEGRGWELFARRGASELVQKVGIEVLHRIYGRSGPVYWVLCTPAND